MDADGISSAAFRACAKAVLRCRVAGAEGDLREDLENATSKKLPKGKLSKKEAIIFHFHGFSGVNYGKLTVSM